MNLDRCHHPLQAFHFIAQWRDGVEVFVVKMETEMPALIMDKISHLF